MSASLKPYNVWTNIPTWLGVTVHKYPPDLIHYAEIIFESKPDLIIETGTWRGGSAYFFASLMDLNGRGRVITVDNYLWDVEVGEIPKHPRITYIEAEASEFVPNPGKGHRVMVVLDSAHDYEHVKKELENLAPLVSPGCYLVVEDTISCPDGAGQACVEFLLDPASLDFDLMAPPPMTTNAYLRRRDG